MARRAKPTPRPEVLLLEDRAVPATLSGVVYADSNGNNTQDAGEIGLAGVAVLLDVNSSGHYDATATTDANGNYTFSALSSGNHTIQVIPPVSTTTLGTTTAQAVVASTDMTVKSIGLRPNGMITGTIYADLNGNNIQDANEPGLAGVYVSLGVKGNGTASFNTTSGADGKFQFSNVPDGLSTVTVTAPVNYKPTALNTQNAIVTNGNTVSGVNFGEQPTTALTGKVFLMASQTGVPGVVVSLDSVNGTAAQTTTTTPDGLYLFSNVSAGPHTITLTAPAGTQFNTSDGSNTLSTNVQLNGTGNIQSGLDVGVSYPGSVTGRIYVDANGDSKKNTSERAVSPGTITIDLNGAGHPITVAPTIQADGSFKISGLPDGTHYITVTPPGGLNLQPTRQQFTITGGAASTIPDIAVAGNSSGVGNTLVLGGVNSVKTYNFSKSSNGTLVATPGTSITPPGTGTNARAASADFNGDGVADTIAATSGGGGITMVHVYDGVTGADLVPAGIQAFDGNFGGAVNLAAGDFNGDGKADLVVAADVGGGPRVRIFNASQFLPGADPAQGRLLADFFAIDDTKFRGGVRVAVGDLNKDGTVDLVVAAGNGGGPRVAVFEGQSMLPGNTPQKLVADFFAFEPGLRNGANIAIGDVNGDGQMDLVATAGNGGAPRVTVFSGAGIMANLGATSARIADFYVNGDISSRSGSQVTVKDIDGDGRADVVASNQGRAYVFTSANISANFINPQPNGPAAAVALDGLGGSLSLG